MASLMLSGALTMEMTMNYITLIGMDINGYKKKELPIIKIWLILILPSLFFSIQSQ